MCFDVINNQKNPMLILGFPAPAEQTEWNKPIMKHKRSSGNLHNPHSMLNTGLRFKSFNEFREK